MKISEMHEGGTRSPEEILLVTDAAAYGALSAYYGKEYARKYLKVAGFFQFLPSTITDPDMDQIDFCNVEIFKDIDVKEIDELYEKYITQNNSED